MWVMRPFTTSQSHFKLNKNRAALPDRRATSSVLALTLEMSLLLLRARASVLESHLRAVTGMAACIRVVVLRVSSQTRVTMT